MRHIVHTFTISNDVRPHSKRTVFPVILLVSEPLHFERLPLLIHLALKVSDRLRKLVQLVFDSFIVALAHVLLLL